jgi:hypothetical protein
MALGDDAWKEVPLPPRSREPLPLHAVFRLAYLARPAAGLSTRGDPAPLRLLLAGRLQDAANAALRGLEVRGVRPKVRTFMGSADLARRLAASITIPISERDVFILKDVLAKPDMADATPT